jgi:hypothetical protein
VRVFITLVVFLLLQACKHPLAIEGEGDIVERNIGHRGCTLEEFEAGAPRCTDNAAVDEPYQVVYQAVPRPGWRFVGWEGTPCDPDSVPPFCHYDVTEPWVVFTDLAWPGTEIPATTAVFEEFNLDGIGY